MFERTSAAALFLAAAVLLPVAGARGEDVPEGYWSEAQARALLDKTLTVRLAPDLSGLSAAQAAAVERLLAAGRILQRLYEQALHHQALAARRGLEELAARSPGPHVQGLFELYRLFQGPIATTLDNQRVPFLPVDGTCDGKNVYPWGIEKAALDGFLEQAPDMRPSVLDLRSLVRRATPEALAADLAVLRTHPVLAALHPGLEPRLEELQAGTRALDYYAVPYSVAYAPDLLEVSGLLWDAARLIAPEEPDFADYLRHRSRDLLCDDYEAGDAAWVCGRLGTLNAELGSYETYDDSLYAVKSFFAASVLLCDAEKSEAMRAALSGIQAIEDSLPCARHERIREDIPIGVYNVIADFGQARGANTASILPNEARITRKYGRIILLRYNIMTHPELHQVRLDQFTAALDEKHHAELQPDGDYYRTLWHEVGHYLGPKVDDQGRDLDSALEENSDVIEELKSDLVALFSARALHASGYYDDQRLRAVYAGGIRRVLQSVKPRRAQPYQTMQLMQWNYFLKNGLLAFDSASGRLSVDYERLHEVVGRMLETVLDIQARGDKAASSAFIDEHFVWDEALHEVVAQRIRATEKYRYYLVRYAALGE